MDTLVGQTLSASKFQIILVTWKRWFSIWNWFHYLEWYNLLLFYPKRNSTQTQQICSNMERIAVNPPNRILAPPISREVQPIGTWHSAWWIGDRQQNEKNHWMPEKTSGKCTQLKQERNMAAITTWFNGDEILIHNSTHFNAHFSVTITVSNQIRPSEQVIFKGTNVLIRKERRAVDFHWLRSL